MQKIIFIIILLLTFQTTVFADYIIPNTTPIYNQGKAPTCVAYAIKEVIEMQTGQKINYKNIYKYHEPNGGMHIDITLDKLGLEYSILSDTKAIRQAITENYGVLINIQMDKSIYKLSRKGILDKSNRPTNNYHCMVIIGFTDTHWIVQNSWGKYWGCSGLCYIPFDYSLINRYYIIKGGDLTESILRK